ncbi:MAG TPA: hypothetical protein VFE14_16530 [Micromonosporaceae bacterium]|jgi:hypothetical protein|nr:hypothetical protein [Micromonosporaceae bacterium]
MPIPDDGRQPPWLHDYASIHADLPGMRAFASALEAEQEANYTPHRRTVEADMVVQSASPAAQFGELVALLERHDESRQLTNALLTAHGNATFAFARAAIQISQAYGDIDGLAAARAKDVAQIFLMGPAGPAWTGESFVELQ